MRYNVKQITSHHIHRYNNIQPRDVGLWCYFIDDRAYGFTTTEEEAEARAEAAVGSLKEKAIDLPFEYD